MGRPQDQSKASVHPLRRLSIFHRVIPGFMIRVAAWHRREAARLPVQRRDSPRVRLRPGLPQLLGQRRQAHDRSQQLWFFITIIYPAGCSANTRIFAGRRRGPPKRVVDINAPPPHGRERPPVTGRSSTRSRSSTDPFLLSVMRPGPPHLLQHSWRDEGPGLVTTHEWGRYGPAQSYGQRVRPAGPPRLSAPRACAAPAYCKRCNRPAVRGLLSPTGAVDLRGLHISKRGWVRQASRAAQMGAPVVTCMMASASPGDLGVPLLKSSQIGFRSSTHVAPVGLVLTGAFPARQAAAHPVPTCSPCTGWVAQSGIILGCGVPHRLQVSALEWIRHLLMPHSVSGNPREHGGASGAVIWLLRRCVRPAAIGGCRYGADP